MRDVVDAVERYAEPLGDKLREARLVTLTGGHCPHHQFDPSLRQDGDLGTLARETAGDLDVVRKANAAIPAAPPSLVAPWRKAVPIGKLQRLFHRGRVVAAVIREAERVGIRLRAWRDHIATA